MASRLARIGGTHENAPTGAEALRTGFSMYLWLKLVHVSAAVLTISGFVLRGWWMLADSDILQNRIVRIAPHVIDTVFLLSGIGLIWVLHLPVLNQPWLLAKFSALVVYIVLGAIALRRGRSKPVRLLAFALALATFAYIVGVAMTKSITSWLAWI